MTLSASRRTVLTTSAAVAGAAVGSTALAACGGTDSGSGGQSSGQEASAVPSGTQLATLDDVPVGGSTAVTTPDGREVIVSRPAEERVTAFSAICTHQGCTVRPKQAELHCPCHGSTFDPATGEVRKGPAERPLPEIGVRIDGGKIVTA